MQTKGKHYHKTNDIKSPEADNQKLDPRPHTDMAQQRVLTLWMFFLLHIYRQVPCVGCQNTPEVIPIKCNSTDTQSLYAEVKNALWNKDIRPVANTSKVLTVKLGVTVAGILDVNEKDGEVTLFLVITLDWFVPFLRWDNVTCGTNKISYPKSELWLPDIQIREFMDEDKSPDLPYLQLNYTGGVHLVQLKRVAASCQIYIYTFPFDVQECSLTFHSYVLEEDEMKLTSKSLNFTASSSVVSDSGWILVNVTKVFSTYNLTSIRTFSTIQFNITLKRKASLYVVNLLVPSCFLSLLDLFSFFLTPEDSERSAFKITLILGYIVFLLITNDLLPTSSEPTPLISVFFSISLALMVISLLVTMFILNLHNSGHFSPRAPDWLHVLILNYLARLLFMSPKHLAPSETVILNSYSR
ncbi:5-hydroxytryptamine receptor 3A-like, partial [Clarias magur]